MDRPILYIKRGCPWCTDALDFLKEHNVAVEVRDVLADRQAMERMIAISGQTRTPTMEFDGFVCADFDTRELMAALRQKPEVRKRLGLDRAGG